MLVEAQGTIMSRGNDGSGWSMSVWPRRSKTEGQDKEIIRTRPKRADANRRKKDPPEPQGLTKKKALVVSSKRAIRAKAKQAKRDVRMANVIVERIIRDESRTTSRLRMPKKIVVDT
jgi:predicted nucleotide-binding protein